MSGKHQYYGDPRKYEPRVRYRWLTRFMRQLDEWPMGEWVSFERWYVTLNDGCASRSSFLRRWQRQLRQLRHLAEKVKLRFETRTVEGYTEARFNYLTHGDLEAHLRKVIKAPLPSPGLIELVALMNHHGSFHRLIAGVLVMLDVPPVRCERWTPKSVSRFFNLYCLGVADHLKTYGQLSPVEVDVDE